MCITYVYIKIIAKFFLPGGGKLARTPPLANVFILKIFLSKLAVPALHSYTPDVPTSLKVG